MLFNDCTRLLLYNNNEQIEYIDKDMAESYHTLRSYPESLVKKVTLLKYFRNYMSEHLLKVRKNLLSDCLRQKVFFEVCSEIALGVICTGQVCSMILQIFLSIIANLLPCGVILRL